MRGKRAANCGRSASSNACCESIERLPDAEAATRAELHAETRPEDAAALAAEREAGLEADDLTCADGTAVVHNGSVEQRGDT